MTSRCMTVVTAAALACLTAAPASAQLVDVGDLPSAVSTDDAAPVDGDGGGSTTGDESASEVVGGPTASRCRVSADEATGSRLGLLSSSRDECADWYQCRRVDVARVERSLLGFVVFKFWHWKRWCWRYPRVFNVTTGVYLTNVDPNWHYGGIKAAWNSQYVWCCRRADTGHVSFRQGRFDNCPFRIGCIRAVHPWVKIRAHGDGSYRWSTGT